MCEREASDQVIAGVVSATNRLIERRNTAPGSSVHADALGDLAKLLANTPGAIEELKRRQNGKPDIEEH
ncbi:MAG: hypothetical protein HYZ02_01255 [Candidatus Levybacteria bacterium]|nr:hypothetical protein [Candidatus Levybacteria bacterium]MBI3092843.1 hypothetical protein [Candidatus Levybacteria bacterium]